MNNKWQSIETAPKDGTRILVCWCNSVTIVYWSDTCQHGQFKSYPGWQIWDVDEDSFYSVGLKEDEPTHWMQLPDPPKI